MFRKFGLPILAGIGLLFAVYMVCVGRHKPPMPPIEFPPPKPPYAHYVAGSGIIEASSENINVGTGIDGIVTKIYVDAGQIVEEGTPLFELDTRQLRAEEKTAMAAKEVSLASLQRLMKQPRPEEIPPLEARVRQAKAHLNDEATQFQLFKNVSDKRAISFNDFSQRKYASYLAKYELDQVKAELDLLKAGAWIEDIKVASAQLEQRDAELKAIQTALERSVIRAPIKGLVMQININDGEYARGGAEDNVARDPLMIFGSVDPLHIRIDVDEDDAWRVFPGSAAMAYARGNSSIQIPLQFVRIEPYIVPKRSLTGDDLERVDTRVLQLIYSFEKKDLPIYLGQLMDIYIEAKPSRGL